MITKLWVEKLIEGGPRTNLQECADNVQNYHECLITLGATGELHSQSSLAALIRKLPASLQNRWRDLVVQAEGEAREASRA